MKDYMGVELNVGQEAISIEPGSGSSGPSSWNFRRVRVLRFTATLVELCLSGAVPPTTEPEASRWKRWNTWKRAAHKIISLPVPRG